MEIKNAAVASDYVFMPPSKWRGDDFLTNRQNVVEETGSAPCKTNCPAHISVQGYLKKAGEGKYREALERIKKENPFPAMCGRVCARFNEGKKAAVIGSGPAGLSAAYYLAVWGHDVTVFEKEVRPGGMMTFGMPEFRLDRKVVEAEIDVIRMLGVEIKCGVEVGKDVTLNQLRGEGYKGFYVAVGAQGGRRLGITGEDSKGAISGIDFLKGVSVDRMEKLHGNVKVVVKEKAKKIGRIAVRKIRA